MTIIKPYGTATWLLRNTSLSFIQIAEFCGIQLPEVVAIENGAISEKENNPLEMGQLSREEIEICQKDQTLKLKKTEIKLSTDHIKQKKYVPLLQRANKLNVVLWFSKNHPTIKKTIIAKLVGSTTKTVKDIFDGTYTKISTLSVIDPVQAGFCTQRQLNEILNIEPSDANK